MEAIVTDAHNLITLTVIRSLGRAGISVRALAEGERPLTSIPAAWSRFGRVVRVPPIERYPSEFWAQVEDMAGPETVFVPVLLNSVTETAARLRSHGAPRTLVSGRETLEELDQTDRLIRRARTLDIPTPRTFAPSPEEDPDPLSWDQLDFPAVIKYRHGDVLGLEARDRYRIVRDREELAREYWRMHGVQARPLVQEYVEGTGYGVSALYDREGRLAAAFCHRRLREFPITGGPSALAESVWEDDLVEYGTRLLESVGLVGVGMVEFKREARTGQFKLMEVNPRFWGSLPLAVMSGVDFPVLYWRLAQGERVRPVLDYRLGQRMRYLPKDLGAMYQMVRQASGNRFGLGLRLARQLLDTSTGEALFQLADPLPGLLYILGRLGRGGRSG